MPLPEGQAQESTRVLAGCHAREGVLRGDGVLGALGSSWLWWGSGTGRPEPGGIRGGGGLALPSCGVSWCQLGSHGGFLPAGWPDVPPPAAGATMNSVFRGGAEIPFDAEAPEGRCTSSPWTRVQAGLGQRPHPLVPWEGTEGQSSLRGRTSRARAPSLLEGCKTFLQRFWLQKGLILCLDVSRSVLPVPIHAVMAAGPGKLGRHRLGRAGVRWGTMGCGARSRWGSGWPGSERWL